MINNQPTGTLVGGSIPSSITLGCYQHSAFLFLVSIYSVVYLPSFFLAWLLFILNELQHSMSLLFAVSSGVYYQSEVMNSTYGHHSLSDYLVTMFQVLLIAEFVLQNCPELRWCSTLLLLFQNFVSWRNLLILLDVSLIHNLIVTCYFVSRSDYVVKSYYTKLLSTAASLFARCSSNKGGCRQP